jgi:hypothetical protein
MSDDFTDGPPPFSREALYLFGFLRRHGGSMRLGPLLRHVGLDTNTLIAAINELSARHWIRIFWRKSAAAFGDDDRPLTDIDRIATTRFGRWRSIGTWAAR